MSLEPIKTVEVSTLHGNKRIPFWFHRLFYGLGYIADEALKFLDSPEGKERGSFRIVFYKHRGFSGTSEYRLEPEKAFIIDGRNFKDALRNLYRDKQLISVIYGSYVMEYFDMKIFSPSGSILFEGPPKSFFKVSQKKAQLRSEVIRF